MTQRIHGGDVAKVQKSLGFKKGELIDFSANINPLGPSPRVMEELRKNLEEIINYPDPRCTELREAVLDYYPVEDSSLIFGNGASELIFILMKVLKPSRVLIPAPTFIEYQYGAESVNSQVQFLNLPHENSYSLPVEELLGELSRVDLVFLCNPNNPTGTLWEKEEIKNIVERAGEKGAWVVLDEAFMDFLEKEDNYSLLRDFKSCRYQNLFILRSMTKFFAIPGLRLGWGVGPPKIIERMERAKDPWNVNILAQMAGKRALEDKHYILKTRQLIKKEKKFLFEELEKIKGLKPYWPGANYVFVELERTGPDSGVLRDRLSRKGFLIRDCASYPNLSSRFFRAAVR
ncbi:MAG: threonine-phosphate decarboxylase, partial [Candidatus Syntrophonatronum acetioxidans]